MEAVKLLPLANYLIGSASTWLISDALKNRDVSLNNSL